jgi:hypothetical protein
VSAPSQWPMMPGAEPDVGPLAVLKRVRSVQRPRPGERCDMCAVGIPDDHSHVVNLETRELLCSCQACYLLFVSGSAGNLRAVPERYLALMGFSLTKAQWETLQVPVSVAFLFSNSRQEEIAAFYPSPAGATECLLPLGAWDEITATHTVLRELLPDVEAALVHVEKDISECFVVPIDICYELVGVLRKLWRGFDGGKEAQEALSAFFDRVRARAKPVASGSLEGADLPGTDTDLGGTDLGSTGQLSSSEELHA